MTTANAGSTPHLIQPCLFFGGRCEEALAFYRAVGAEVDMAMHFDESPDPVPAGMLQPGFEKKVMHSSFRVGGSTVMALDGCSEGAKFSGFSPRYGMLTDRFCVGWMVIVPGEPRQ